jgi:Uroporphyrinogen decarboxylase (URO-D)
MNGRKKIEAALSMEGTREFAAVIPYEEIYIRDHWPQLTINPWWYSRSPDLEHQLAWRREAVARIGQDWMELPACASHAFRQEYQIRAGEQGVSLVSRLTGEEFRIKKPVVGGWESFDSASSGHAACLADSLAAIEEQIPLQPATDLLEIRAEGRGDLAQALLSEYGDSIYPMGGATSPLWKCYRLWGFTGLMEMIATRPALVEAACDRFLQNELNAVREAAALRAAGIWIEECLTDMIHPQDFELLNLPYVQALVEEIRSLGMKSIYYYCGNPAGKLTLLLASGADALSLEESKKGFSIDIAELAEFAGGRCALLGNLDAIDLLPHASEPALRAEIARQAAAGRRNGGRFVMSLGSPVTPGTSPERVRRYCQLVHELKNK